MKNLSRAVSGAVALLSLVVVGGCVVGTPEPMGTSQEAVTVCGQSTVHGMDISHFDGAINWSMAKASGIDFAIAKATESTNFTDPTFATNWAGMKAAGVVRGAYHFFHADVDPVAQANFVIQTVGPLAANDLPITLDLETTNGQSESVILANAITFLDTVTQKTGRTAIVYVSPSFLSSYAGLEKYLLWIANWGVNCPDVPGPWATWTFWQSSSTGTVPGVGASSVDLDTFNGTLAQLGMVGGGSVSGGDAGGGGGMDAGGPVNDGGGTPGVDSSGGGPTRDGGIAPVGDSGGLAGDAASATPPAWAAPTGQSGGCSLARSRQGSAPSFLATGLLALALATAHRRRR